MSENRRHHYCPACYLANFAIPVEREGNLFVYDIRKGENRPGKPNTVGFARDYYKIEHEQPNIIEKEFAGLEDRVGPIIRQIISDSIIPESTSEEFFHLMEFIALLAMRIPSRRNFFSKQKEKFLKMVLQNSVMNKGVFDNIKRKATDFLGEKTSDVSYEEMKKFIEEDEFCIEISNHDGVKLILESAKTIMPFLLARKWRLAIAKGSEKFVTSDNPVSLRLMEAPKGFLDSPGFGRFDTVVSLVISPEICMIGTFHPVSTDPLSYSDKHVCIVNSWALDQADRFLYGRHDSFSWYTREGNIESWTTALPHLRNKYSS